MDAAAPLEHDLKYFRQLIGVLLMVVPAAAFSEMHVVVIEGLGGEPHYAKQFGEQIDAIENAAQSLTGDNRIRVFHAILYRIDALPDLLRYSSSGITETDYRPIWDAPAVFLLLLMLKGGEWMLRRRWSTL